MVACSDTTWNIKLYDNIASYYMNYMSQLGKPAVTISAAQVSAQCIDLTEKRLPSEDIALTEIKTKRCSAHSCLLAIFAIWEVLIVEPGSVCISLL